MPELLSDAQPLRLAFVCMGNICRSPTAEVIFAQLATDAGRLEQFTIMSSGTDGWHAGHEMDPRARATLISSGYFPRAHRARQFSVGDFAATDLILAMDRRHAEHLIELADWADEPDRARSSVRLLRSFDERAVKAAAADPVELNVADPYHGGPDGFALVLANIEAACRGLLDAVPKPTELG